MGFVLGCVRYYISMLSQISKDQSARFSELVISPWDHVWASCISSPSPNFGESVPPSPLPGKPRGLPTPYSPLLRGSSQSCLLGKHGKMQISKQNH